MLMVANRARDVLERVRTAEDHDQLSAVRELKSQIIGAHIGCSLNCSVYRFSARYTAAAAAGNKKRKLSYVQLGAVPTMLDLLGSSDAALQQQCVDCVGSFAHATAGVTALVHGGGVTRLHDALTSSTLSVVTAGLRSLEKLLQVRPSLACCHARTGRCRPDFA